jgi:hypothetical protein
MNNNEPERLLCVGGPQAGRYQDVCADQNRWVYIKPVFPIFDNDGRISVSERTYYERQHIGTQDEKLITFLVPMGQTPEQTMSALAQGYAGYSKIKAAAECENDMRIDAVSSLNETPA